MKFIYGVISSVISSVTENFSVICVLCIICILLSIIIIMIIFASINTNKYNTERNNLEENKKILFLKENQNFKCLDKPLKENYKYYKYLGNKDIAYYLSETIAKSHDPNIENAQAKECTKGEFNKGDNNENIKPITYNLKDMDYFKCKTNPIIDKQIELANSNKFYVFLGNEYNKKIGILYYPALAYLYTLQNKKQIQEIDCTGLEYLERKQYIYPGINYVDIYIRCDIKPNSLYLFPDSDRRDIIQEVDPAKIKNIQSDKIYNIRNCVGLTIEPGYADPTTIKLV